MDHDTFHGFHQTTLNVSGFRSFTGGINQPVENRRKKGKKSMTAFQITKNTRKKKKTPNTISRNTLAQPLSLRMGEVGLVLARHDTHLPFPTSHGMKVKFLRTQSFQIRIFNKTTCFRSQIVFHKMWQSTFGKTIFNAFTLDVLLPDTG